MNDFDFEWGSIVGSREFFNESRLLALDEKERSRGRKNASALLTTAFPA